MLSRFLAVSLVVVSTSALLPAQTPADAKALDIYFIDTEGGQATRISGMSGKCIVLVFPLR